MMKLDAKGKEAPPPKLASAHAQRLSETLATWERVHPRTHWQLGDETIVDGADFYVGQDELGHLHLDGEAHVAVGAHLRDKLVEAKLARPFRWSREFVTWPTNSEPNRARAEWLFSLRYLVLSGRPESDVVARIQQAARA